MSHSQGLAASRWASPALPSLDEFFFHAERLSTSSLDVDNALCHICQEEFEPLYSHQSINADTRQTFELLDALPFLQPKSAGVDEPVRLPCSHILGSECLKQWLSSSGAASCPLCKRDLITKCHAHYEGATKYSRRLQEIEALPFRALVKAEWTDEHTVLFPVETSQMRDRLNSYVEKAIRTVQRTFDLNLLGSDLMEVGELLKSLGKELENQAGHEHMPAKLYEQLLQRACVAGSEHASWRLWKVIELSVRAVIEYERRICELDFLLDEANE